MGTVCPDETAFNPNTSFDKNKKEFDSQEWELLRWFEITIPGLEAEVGQSTQLTIQTELGISKKCRGTKNASSSRCKGEKESTSMSFLTHVIKNFLSVFPKVDVCAENQHLYKKIELNWRLISAKNFPINHEET